jgi:predicted  nucleic acid-binding Zn ribbon protein
MASSDPYFKLRPPQPTPEDEICKCEGVKPVKLMQALGFNPLHCIDCNLEILPESLALSEPLVEDIVEWARLYEAIHALWLDSGPYEGWAKDQLSDIESPANQRGLDVRKKLEKIRPCYYRYFQDQSADDFKAATICPSCGGSLTPYLQGIFPQLICQSCKIIMAG